MFEGGAKRNVNVGSMADTAKDRTLDIINLDQCGGNGVTGQKGPELSAAVTEEIKDEGTGGNESTNKVQSERGAEKYWVKGNEKGLGEACVICCDRIADAVLLPCGHGGLCFECGKRVGKQGADCHLCRKVR